MLWPSRWTLNVLPPTVLPLRSFWVTSGSPAAASKVGNISMCEPMPLKTEPALILPGQRGNAPSAFPVGVLLRSEGRVGAIRPGVVLWAVVGGVHDDGVVGDTQRIEL